MPKGSPELTATRRAEIIDACEELYRELPFKDITVGMIAERTTFTRASVYNYFKTKEEIFLALLQREYELWNATLSSVLEGPELDAEGFAEALASSLDGRGQLLKILSMNHYDLEGSSRHESLVAFKREYGHSLALVEDCLRRFFPNMGGDARRDFVYTFFPMMFGIYPYTVVTDAQRIAMSEAGVDFAYASAHGLIRASALRLLGNGSQSCSIKRV